MPLPPADPIVARALAEMCLAGGGDIEMPSNVFARELVRRLPPAHTADGFSRDVALAARPLLSGVYGVSLVRPRQNPGESKRFRLVLTAIRDAEMAALTTARTAQTTDTRSGDRT